MSTINLLGIAGSLRKASTNRGLLRTAQASLPEGVRLEIADLTDVPFYIYGRLSRCKVFVDPF